MSEPQVVQEPEGKSSMAQPAKPKPHIRACESCRIRKIKCLPQDPSKDDARCQRCTKSGRECIYSSPEKRKRRKRTDARVADLEHMVQILAARLEQEQRARHDQEPGQEREQQSPSQDKIADILSPPPSPNKYSQVKHLLNQDAGRRHLHSPTTMATEPNLDRQQSISSTIGDTVQTVEHSQIPRMVALSPGLVIQEPLPSPLSQNRIPDILCQPHTAWPSFPQFLDLEHHQQATSTEDVYSPCPSHSSTLSHSDICSSEMSPNTILDVSPHDNTDMMFDLPTSGAEYNSMDAAISAQLNMPCQDQGIWWPQSNIICNELPGEPAPAGGWIQREDAFTWQTMQWA
ncbi:MAG: hypothetical protein Q9172_001317 [Xanthocarpia lactea]